MYLLFFCSTAFDLFDYNHKCNIYIIYRHVCKKLNCDCVCACIVVGAQFQCLPCCDVNACIVCVCICICIVFYELVFRRNSSAYLVYLCMCLYCLYCGVGSIPVPTSLRFQKSGHRCSVIQRTIAAFISIYSLLTQAQVEACRDIRQCAVMHSKWPNSTLEKCVICAFEPSSSQNTPLTFCS